MYNLDTNGRRIHPHVFIRCNLRLKSWKRKQKPKKFIKSKEKKNAKQWNLIKTYANIWKRKMKTIFLFTYIICLWAQNCRKSSQRSRRKVGVSLTGKRPDYLLGCDNFTYGRRDSAVLSNSMWISSGRLFRTVYSNACSHKKMSRDSLSRYISIWYAW